MMLNQILGIKYPIIQGAMANIATAEFAAAVSNQGAMGIIASGAMSVEQAREAIHKTRQLTNEPFGINVMLMHPDVDAMMAMICEEKVDLVTCGAGNPGKYIKDLKASGTKIFPVVASVALAKRMEKSGVDGLIVEGGESGGHVGQQSTMALVPQVVDAVSIPVVAAGGIADGRGFNAALSLGAVGVQIGTVLLATKECPIHDNYKQAVLKAKDTETVVTGRSQNAPVRIMKNKMSRQYLKEERNGANREVLEKLTLGGLRRAVIEGDMQTGSVMMGQIAGMIHEIKPLKAVFEELMSSSLKELIKLEKKLKELSC